MLIKQLNNAKIQTNYLVCNIEEGTVLNESQPPPPTPPLRGAGSGWRNAQKGRFFVYFFVYERRCGMKCFEIYVW